MKVHVIGCGVISALGENFAENLNALSNKRHGITTDASVIDRLITGIPVAKIPLTNLQLALKAGTSARWHRTALLGVLAAKEAVNSSLIDIKKYRTGFISGTTVGGMDFTEGFFRTEFISKGTGRLHKIINHECGKTSSLIAGHLGADYFVSTLNTACSSAANAILFAARMIKHNKLDLAIAGGTDALTSFTLNGFNSLLLLDNDLCRPFDARRKGLNMGEGAGYLLLASDRIVQKLNCKVMAELSGYANASDSFHQTALSEDGVGPYLAMSNALNMANLETGQVGYINLHGTATPNNDIAEGTAIRRLFGQNAPALSSTKSYTGHTLGASGGIEAVYTVHSLVSQTTIAGLRFEQIMPETGLIPEIEVRSINIQHALSNSFGFGGNCCSLLFSKNC